MIVLAQLTVGGVMKGKSFRGRVRYIEQSEDIGTNNRKIKYILQDLPSLRAMSNQL